MSDIERVMAQIPATAERLADKISYAGGSRRFAINREASYRNATFRVEGDEIIGYGITDEVVSIILDHASDAAAIDLYAGHIFRINTRSAKLVFNCACGGHEG